MDREDDQMPVWAVNLNRAVDKFGWPARERAKRLADASGIDVSSCRVYLKGKVAHPGGKRLEWLAKAVNLTEAELLGLADSTPTGVNNANRSLMSGASPSGSEREPLANMEAKMERQINELWKYIGRLETRLEKLEEPSAKPSSHPSKAR